MRKTLFAVPFFPRRDLKMKNLDSPFRGFSLKREKPIALFRGLIRYINLSENHNGDRSGIFLLAQNYHDDATNRLITIVGIGSIGTEEL